MLPAVAAFGLHWGGPTGLDGVWYTKYQRRMDDPAAFPDNAFPDSAIPGTGPFDDPRGVAERAPREATVRLRIEPLDVSVGLRKRVCEAIKRAIMDMDLYGQSDEIRLDERQLSQDLGVSRTPIREALSVLEQEGFVRSIPRRGIVVVRKTKREIVEMITVWASIEAMAARLAASRVTEADLAELRALVDRFQDDPGAQIHEYSDANMAFHRAIIRLGGVALMGTLIDGLFIHMRAVRAVTMTQDNRARRSISDHQAIIAALAAHDVDRAEYLVREHTLGLADHVEQHGDFLDGPLPAGAATRHRRYA